MAYLMHDRRNKELQHHLEDRNFPDCRKLVGIRNGVNNLLEHDRQSKRNSECPIYIHEYSKIPSCSITNKNFVNIGVTALKNTQIKSINNQNPKKMLNKLEETYWATWKPKKNKNKDFEKPKTPYKSHRKEKNEKDKKDNTPYGDAAGELIQYFNKPNFSSTGSVSDEKDIQNQYQIIPAPFNPTVEITPFPEEGNKDLTEKTIDEQLLDKTVLSIDSNPSSSILKLNSDKPVISSQVTLDDKDESDINNEFKLFKHTDSFVINENKKQEPKENHFQQPKCIKLYKKSGANNYVKGGSYPLKMSKKKDLSSMRNFRLGPPGQLIVTGSSYNKTMK